MSTRSETGLAKPGRPGHQSRRDRRSAISCRFVDAWDEPSPPAPDPEAPLRPGSAITGSEFLELFRCQIQSRHLDLVAREMRARNEGFYTIGSAGHEGNAALGYLSRIDDPAFLHYRSGGFMMARGAKIAGADPLYDTALSLAASARRSGLRRSPQGVGQSQHLGAAADLDHRQPSAQGRRYRHRTGAGHAHRRHATGAAGQR